MARKGNCNFVCAMLAANDTRNYAEHLPLKMRSDDYSTRVISELW